MSHEVHLIEVKYLMDPRADRILKDAEKMVASWKPSYLFLATPMGFFFDKASTIVENKGVISPLSHPHISKEIQTKYIGLLNEFIPPNTDDGGGN
jgi:hypothetical protein